MIHELQSDSSRPTGSARWTDGLTLGCSTYEGHGRWNLHEEVHAVAGLSCRGDSDRVISWRSAACYAKACLNLGIVGRVNAHSDARARIDSGTCSKSPAVDGHAHANPDWTLSGRDTGHGGTDGDVGEAHGGDWDLVACAFFRDIVDGPQEKVRPTSRYSRISRRQAAYTPGADRCYRGIRAVPVQKRGVEGEGLRRLAGPCVCFRRGFLSGTTDRARYRCGL